jgi:hypothetical protein
MFSGILSTRKMIKSPWAAMLVKVFMCLVSYG